MTQLPGDSTQNFVFNMPAVANARRTPEPNLPMWMTTKPKRCANCASSSKSELDPFATIRLIRVTAVFSISDY
jgi:hypothetical protein